MIAACNAASAGRLDILKKLHEQGVDLNQGDYDMRTPLHVSCGIGHMEIATFLVDVAKVKVSPVDRWSATPLNDCKPYPELTEFLLSKGASLGKP